MEELFKFQVEDYFNIFYSDKTEVEDRSFRDYEMIPIHNGAGELNFLFKERPYKPKKLEFTKVSESTEHSDFIENYGNPLTSVKKVYMMIVVEKNDKKVSLKIFNGSRLRGAGKTHFRVRKNVIYLTLNKETGDVYYGTLNGFNLKKKSTKSISKNNFYANYFQILHHKVTSHVTTCHDMSEKLVEALNIFVSDFSSANANIKIALSDVLLEFYLNKKNIKYPNNFKLFFKDYEYRLPLPFIRKNGNKLIEAFMNKNELKGASIKKALHEATTLNLPILNMVLFMFPNDWVYQDEDLIKKCLHFNSNSNTFHLVDLGENIEELNMSNVEKRRMFDLFRNEVVTQKVMLHTFFDHISFYRQLKIFGEEVKWMAKNKADFQTEHVEFSDRVDFYKKGHYYRIYPHYMYDMIQEPFTIKDETYYPVLLDNSTNYNDESLTQSNCVKNYVGTSGAIIISLRRKSINSDVRSTIEFRIANKPNEKMSFTVPQALGKFNSRLTEDWNEPLDFLKKRFFKCIRDSKFETVKLKKVFKNGKELSSDSSWDEYGNLRWESVDITKYY
jgi:hypothetical protein